MNAELSNLQPLSPALQSSACRDPSRPVRRHQVGSYPLHRDGLDRFNHVLAGLGQAALDCDQLATASRDLAQHPDSGRFPAAIEQRMRRATTIGLMLADPSWQAANDAVAPAHLVMSYVLSNQDLIPDDLPLIGRLDDAIVIDAAWPQLADEVGCYLDYYRVREIEAGLRGCDVRQFDFSRADWEQARRAEAAWIAHCRDAGARSYLPSAAPACFRVC